MKLAQAAGWEVAVTATPEALAFIDAPLLETITGFPGPPSVAGAG